MRANRTAVLSCTALGLLLSGCSTHPLPEDYLRQTTSAIVKRMRCEISEGIRNLPDASTAQLQSTFVGFDFTLTMTEDNKAADAEVGFLSPIHNGEFKINFGGGASKQRKNVRGFRIIDTFERLKQEKGCSAQEQRANFIYPVAGRIGLSEVVETYWDLKKRYEFKMTDTDRAFIDKLGFTTTIGLGITPSITLSSGNANFRLTDASIDGSVTRTDLHEITIAVIETQPPPPPKRSGSKTKQRDMPQTQIERLDESERDAPPVVYPRPGASDRLNRALNRELDRDALERRF